MSAQETIGKISLTFLDVLNQLKIYHWQTASYARHKSSCQLITQLSDLTDKIIETLQGSKNLRLYINNELTELGKQNYLHKIYDEKLKEIFGAAVSSPDEVVTEGGILK